MNPALRSLSLSLLRASEPLEQSYIFSTESFCLKIKGENDFLTSLRRRNGPFYYIVPTKIRGKTEDIVLYFYYADEDDALCDYILIQPRGNCFDDVVAFQVTMHSNSGAKVDYVASCNDSPNELNSIYISPADIQDAVASCGHVSICASLAVKSSRLHHFIGASKEKMQDEPEKCHHVLSCNTCGPQPVPSRPYPPSWMPLFRKGPFLDDKGTNFDIIVKGTTFYSHKSVLMTESTVFVGMMESPLQEGQRGSVNIVDFEPEEMKMFLTIYYDRATFAQYSRDCGSLMSIHRLAHKYEVQDIIQRCVQAFASMPFDPEQHYTTLIFDADLYGVPELMERCAREFDNLPESYLDDFPDFVNANPKAAAAFFKQLAKVRREEHRC